MLLKDGHPTTISFSADASVVLVLEEKEVTPPGMDGGGPNDTTTMRNNIYRTRQPKSLITATDISFSAAYDPAIYDNIAALINVNNQVTITFPDNSSITVWGWLDKFTPGSCVEGTQPIANCTIVPSNQNDSGVETAPAYNPAP